MKTILTKTKEEKPIEKIVIKKKKPVKKRPIIEFSKYDLKKPVYKKREDGILVMKIDPNKDIVVGLELNTITRELRIRVKK